MQHRQQFGGRQSEERPAVLKITLKCRAAREALIKCVQRIYRQRITISSGGGGDGGERMKHQHVDNIVIRRHR